MTLEQTSAPAVISHYNLFRSAEIDGSAAPGLSSSEGLAQMQKLAQQTMMQGMSYSWTGLALEEIESAGKTIIIFGLGILVVYLTLSAQYESFALPFIILLAVPMAVLGALLAQSMRGLPNDVYCQIGLVMLIGLSAKNSILIVEFAEQLRRQGRTIMDAAIEAAELRLRPILMTSLAFILGVMPLVLAHGAGENGRHSVGTTVVGGMVLSTVLNLFFIRCCTCCCRRCWAPVGAAQSRMWKGHRCTRRWRACACTAKTWRLREGGACDRCVRAVREGKGTRECRFRLRAYVLGLI